MLKSLIANSLAKRGAGSVAMDVDCSQFTSCGSCIAQEGCGFCGNLASCVSGGWFGALDKSACGLNDYYYHQCHISTLPLGIITIVLISVIIIAVLIGISIFCCCLCCNCCQDKDREEEDEDRPLLGNKYLRRSSTYYQWNRAPVQRTEASTSNNKNKMVLADESPSHSTTSDADLNQKNWEDRRTALLKKYAREPTTSPPDE